MAEYSIEVCRALEEKLREAKLYRPLRIARYDKGTELTYDVTGVSGANTGRVHLVVERFVGGGFAGQVYQVKVLNIEATNGPIDGLKTGGIYAIKILIPPSGFSLFFRNLVYWVGFQAPFQLQVNPAASRAGALWQKLVRRGAGIRFGDERTVVDIHATFVDETLGSCGEISEWVEGRTWRLEVDDHMDDLKKWRKGKNVGPETANSLEYRAKHIFMKDFVKLLRDMGGHELVRQYEWSTCKSQPNCLKRSDTEEDPSRGLVAVDFRAGLALLPFLPMSPGDFKLIARGIGRGSLVQFDRCNLRKLEGFVDANSAEFTDMRSILDELKECERIYRDSIPDITHNHFRLIYSGRLWSTILNSRMTGWRVKNTIDRAGEQRLHRNKILALLFFIIAIIPFFGRITRKICAHAGWRRHYWKFWTNWGYFRRTLRARIAEKIIVWHRAGRLSPERATRLGNSGWRYLGHLPLSVLPVGLHRFLTDLPYAKERLYFLLVRPVRLYFDADLREQWLRNMIVEGRKKHMLTDDDADIILSQVKEPFIQKYLKSLAVHICTLPITQVVSVIIALIYVWTHPEMPRAYAWGVGVGIIALFQVIPISPGSLVRGFYVLFLVIKERNFKDYNIAVFLGFFKYVGYLAFPIQMTYHYPAMARFMAAHWATEAVHIVPVFGERGALLEHWVFGLFYNWPLTIRRRIRERSEVRAAMKPRYWHIPLVAVAATGLFGLADYLYLQNFGRLPTLQNIWYLTVLLPLLTGIAVTLGCRGLELSKRIIFAAACGVVIGFFYTAASTGLGMVDGIVANTIWRVFIFTMLAAIGAIFTELRLPGPKNERQK